MTPTPQDWDRRFRQQSGWTRQIRAYILSRLGLGASSRVLEVGCGTGVITAGLRQETPALIFGLDLNLDFLRLARQNDPSARITAGNAQSLPFPTGAFDAVVCHFLFLWLAQPAGVLAEMVRVVRPGGAVAAFAEPDYGGRIDHPAALVELGRLQAEALLRQGADPHMGRRLSGLFHAAGLDAVETGLLGGQWQGPPSAVEIDSEWATLAADLAGMLPTWRLDELKRQDALARQSGQRVLFVPTFYAVGRKI